MIENSIFQHLLLNILLQFSLTRLSAIDQLGDTSCALICLICFFHHLPVLITTCTQWDDMFGIKDQPAVSVCAYG